MLQFIEQDMAKKVRFLLLLARIDATLHRLFGNRPHYCLFMTGRGLLLLASAGRGGHSAAKKLCFVNLQQHASCFWANKQASLNYVLKNWFNS
jgi:hypothetical protein